MEAKVCQLHSSLYRCLLTNSLGHEGTVDYIYNTTSAFDDYYTVSKQCFGATTGNIFESKLVIENDVIEDANPMGLTPPTKNKQPVVANLVLVDNEGCNEGDFPSKLDGKIALIKRGVCPFGTKSANAGKAGAIAALVYNSERGSLQGTLGEPNKYHVATFGISDTDAAPYIEKIQKGIPVEASAYIDAIVTKTKTTNVIAQTKGGDQENCVMLGGHSDSVGEGPGINDDGTGSITLLELAVQLTNFSVNNCVRFAWWAGEEEGLLGSNYYVSQLSKKENKKIRLFMDYDMMASPNFAYQIYNANNVANPVGSEELRDLYIDAYESMGLNYTFIPFDGRSDYDGFIRAGIPGGGIATGAEGIKTPEEVKMFGGAAGEWYDHCYHQLCDDLTNLSNEAWQVNAEIIAHSVAVYAKSFDGFPKRNLKEAEVEVEVYAGKDGRYRGNQLIM